MISFYFIFLFSLCYGFIIDPVAKDELADKISLQQLKSIKANLESELMSLILPTNSKQEIKSHNQELDSKLIILPSTLLENSILDKLGLGSLNENSSLFDFKDKKTIIPKEINNLFIFNTTDALSIPRTTHHNFSRFIENSLPFSLPQYMNLINHYLVVPYKFIEEHIGDPNKISKNSSIYSTSILYSSFAKSPIFKSALNENKPLMVFMFTNAKKDTFQKIKNPIMNVKNYMTGDYKMNMISGFFDEFANKWIKMGNYENLIHSIFCTTNTNDVNDSYCLKIKDKRNLHLFPAFVNNNQVLESFENKTNTFISKRNDPDVESQAIRQLHDKLSLGADKFNDVTYEFATEPKQSIEKVDEKFDNKIYDLQDKIDDKKDKLQDQLDQLKEKIASGIDSIKSKLSFPKEKSQANDDYDVGEFDFTVDDNLISKRFLDSDHYLPFENENGIILPLSLIRENEIPVKSPRGKHYSQVKFNENIEKDQLTKRFSIFSKDKKSCEKITWFNVFHHSIFGKPSFCLDNPL